MYDPQHTVAPRTRRFPSRLEPLPPKPLYTATIPRKAIPTPTGSRSGSRSGSLRITKIAGEPIHSTMKVHDLSADAIQWG